MKRKQTIALATLAGFSFLGPLRSSAIASSNKSIDNLSFSTTQKLGANEKSFAAKFTPNIKLANWEKIISPNTSNSSKATAKEITYLLTLQKKRTAKDVAAIEHQKRFCRFDMPGYQFGSNQNIDKLLVSGFLDVSYYTFKHKIKHNRVRPSFLSKDLTIAIENPPHPAYPSAHASQSYLTALILSDVFPKNREALITKAKLIGSNRELAGVHYPSDTKAGQDIAVAYYKKLKMMNSYQSDIQAIKSSLTLGKGFTAEECEGMLSHVLQPYR